MTVAQSVQRNAARQRMQLLTGCTMDNATLDYYKKEEHRLVISTFGSDVVSVVRSLLMPFELSDIGHCKWHLSSLQIFHFTAFPDEKKLLKLSSQQDIGSELKCVPLSWCWQTKRDAILGYVSVYVMPNKRETKNVSERRRCECKIESFQCTQYIQWHYRAKCRHLKRRNRASTIQMSSLSLQEYAL